jgi:preprotein translocase subunit SecA
LRKDEDYTVDEKSRRVTLTEMGGSKVERLMEIDNLYDDINIEISHHVNQALHAHAVMKRDVDYVVKDGQIIIVDEFTGRLMFGRRYSEGLHQAIEAKEGVKIEKESQTLATITFQNYFRMYEKLSGMTGTAMTEEEELRKIYKLEVVVIPTNKTMLRKDYPDVVYRTEIGKFNAVAEDVIDRYQKGQPVLIGTISIEKSEYLSKLLTKRKVAHQVLNAKFHEQEASIVAQAGRLNAVTVSTNMAGRGTDILLGGNPDFMAKKQMLDAGFEPAVIEAAASHHAETEEHIVSAREHYQVLLEEAQRVTGREHDQVLDLGGLHIIGTERHESRRIDNQLRGRAGRQGDLGSSQFYISLEDDLMRLFGSENFMGLMDKLGMDDDQPIENAMIGRALETAQRRVEARNFDLRKHVLEYDDVMNQQREVIYGQRRRVLQGEDLGGYMEEIIRTTVLSAVERFAGGSKYPEEWDLKALLEYAERVFLPHGGVRPEDLIHLEGEEAKEWLLLKAMTEYQAKEKAFGAENMRELERQVTLRAVDAKWMNHLDAMDQLRQGIGLRAYGQKDPLIEYKHEAYDMFSAMIEEIQEEVVRYAYHATIIERPRERRDLSENRYDETEKKPIQAAAAKIGRNELCPCGSGKKYKFCCGKNGGN